MVVFQAVRIFHEPSIFKEIERDSGAAIKAKVIIAFNLNGF
jgi:hypothetical protein